MQSVKDIKTRIKSVSETAKITRAMELISASKMQKSSARYNSSQDYFGKVGKVIYNIVTHTDFEERHPYLTAGRPGKKCFLVIGSDKGLSGGYNHAVTGFALEIIEKEQDPCIYCVGNTVYQFFKENGFDVQELACSPEGTLEDARIIATALVESYKAEEVSEINIVYTNLVTKAVQQPEILKLLPIVVPKKATVNEAGYRERLEFEPDPKTVFDILIPQYLIGVTYGCITAGKYTEHLERMRAMNASTKNANELLEQLQLNYNKARQEKITTELTELSASLVGREEK